MRIKNYLPVRSPPKLKAFLQRWVINTLAVLVAANVVHGIKYDTVGGLIVASLTLGILNSVLRPLLMLLSLPLLILTLGLFTLVINALLLLLVSWLVNSFHVADFWAAFWGALVIGVVSVFANVMTGRSNAQVRVRWGRRPPPGHIGGGSVPVIDV
jgi:putative membrane protein